MKNALNFISSNRQFAIMVAITIAFLSLVIFNSIAYGCINTIASH
jgi:hypothetical protein